MESQHEGRSGHNHGWLAASLYVACGALRLARFNVQFDYGEKRYFRGLPIPAAAEFISSIVLVYYYFGFQGTTDKHIILLLVTYALAALMVKLTDEAAGLSSSRLMLPSKSEKRPRTLVTRCRTWKKTSECAFSIAYVVATDVVLRQSAETGRPCVVAWSAGIKGRVSLTIAARPRVRQAYVDTPSSFARCLSLLSCRSAL